MNEYSSRSHTIFRIIVESRERLYEGKSDDYIDGGIRVATLSLVDLAGSERVIDTQAKGIRLKEGGHINKSLLTLGNVISKLVSHSPHIPYRDSKLTHILEPSLGGNTRTAIICTITPAAIHSDVTLSSLKFANRAKNIKNEVKRNEIIDDQTLIKRLKQEISMLKGQLASTDIHEEIISDAQDKESIENAKKMEEQYRIKLEQLTNMILQSQAVPLPDTKAVKNRRMTIHPAGYERNIDQLQREFTVRPLKKSKCDDQDGCESVPSEPVSVPPKDSDFPQKYSLAIAMRAAAYEAAMISLRKQLESASRFSEKEKVLAESKSEREQLEKVIIQQKQDYEELLDEYAKSNLENTKLKDTAEYFEMQLTSLSKNQKELEEIMESRDNLALELEATKETLRIVSEELENIKNEAKQNNIRDLKTFDKRAIPATDSSDQNIAELRSKLKEFRHEKNLAENAMKNAQKQLETIKSKFQGVEDAKKQALEESKASKGKILQLEKTLKDLESERQMLKSNVDNLKNFESLAVERQSLIESQEQELKQMSSELSESISLNAILERKVNEYESLLANSEKNICDKIDQIQQQIVKEKSLQSELSNLTQQSSSKDVKLAEALAQATEWEEKANSLFNECQLKDAKIDSLSALLVQEKTRITSEADQRQVEAHFEFLEKEQVLLQKNQSMESQIKELTSKLEHSVEENAQMSRDIIVLGQQLQEYVPKLKSMELLQNELRKAQQDRTQMQMDFERVSNLITALKKENASLKESESSFQQVVEEAIGRQKVLEAQLNQITKENHVLKQGSLEQVAKIASLTEKIEKLEINEIQAQQDLNSIKREHAHLLSRKKALEKMVEDFEKKEVDVDIANQNSGAALNQENNSRSSNQARSKEKDSESESKKAAMILKTCQEYASRKNQKLITEVSRLKEENDQLRKIIGGSTR
jgi:centromeric protein E